MLVTVYWMLDRILKIINTKGSDFGIWYLDFEIYENMYNHRR